MGVLFGGSFFRWELYLVGVFLVGVVFGGSCIWREFYLVYVVSE